MPVDNTSIALSSFLVEWWYRLVNIFIFSVVFFLFHFILFLIFLIDNVNVNDENSPRLIRQWWRRGDQTLLSKTRWRKRNVRKQNVCQLTPYIFNLLMLIMMIINNIVDSKCIHITPVHIENERRSSFFSSFKINNS